MKLSQALSLPSPGKLRRNSSPPKKISKTTITTIFYQLLCDGKRNSKMESMLQPGIFNHPRPKRNLLPPISHKKRKIEHKIEEINFDDEKRADYLTGFHKRKVARAKQAQLEAEKMAREERVKFRKQVGLIYS
jgi:hypothetical protein